jgi:hypothetical protein
LLGRLFFFDETLLEEFGGSFLTIFYTVGGDADNLTSFRRLEWNGVRGKVFLTSTPNSQGISGQIIIFIILNYFPFISIGTTRHRF